MERPVSGRGGDECRALAGEAPSLTIRFLGEPKGKMTMTQGKHLVEPVSERDHRQGPATAAVTQGKFWQMHDYIFHHQHTLEDSDLEQFAVAVGLDMQQYAVALADQRALVRIEEDVEGGERSGVQGTPTFFINGVVYRGSWEHNALLAALQTASQGS